MQKFRVLVDHAVVQEKNHQDQYTNVAMPREPPKKEEWEQWRPRLIEWYKTRTADSIADQLKHEYGLNVTYVIDAELFARYG
jgi:hypothetical protein